MNISHEMSYTRFYNIWRQMKGRCNNKNRPNYKWYGGKGIKIEDRWVKFSKFKEDMYESYIVHVVNNTEKNTTIERINLDNGYSKGNCRWATWEEQRANKTYNKGRFLTHDGVTLNMKSWAKLLGILSSTLSMRINQYNWSVERALTTKK